MPYMDPMGMEPQNFPSCSRPEVYLSHVETGDYHHIQVFQKMVVSIGSFPGHICICIYFYM